MTAEKSGEFRGKTVEAAISAGLLALKLSRDEADIEIIRQGSRGVLGIGAEDAVVRVSALRAAQPEPRPAARPEPKPEPAPAARQQAAPVVKPEPRPAPAPRSAPKASEVKAPAAAPGTANGDDKDAAAAEKGRELLLGMLDQMGLKANVEIVRQSDAEASADQRALVLNILGEDLGVLIGRQNETLAALEFITRLMTNQQTHSRTGFVVDVNGYRAKRAESLRRLALRMADQVLQNGRTLAMEPMPPAERRIVHLALQDHPSVATQSVGEGDRRKVTIMLKKS